VTVVAQVLCVYATMWRSRTVSIAHTHARIIRFIDWRWDVIDRSGSAEDQKNSTAHLTLGRLGHFLHQIGISRSAQPRKPSLTDNAHDTVAAENAGSPDVCFVVQERDNFLIGSSVRTYSTLTGVVRLTSVSAIDKLDRLRGKLPAPRTCQHCKLLRYE
jgi:hypothetical protein